MASNIAAFVQNYQEPAPPINPNTPLPSTNQLPQVPNAGQIPQHPASEYAGLRKPQLQQLLKARKLPVTGNKPHLIELLIQNDRLRQQATSSSIPQQIPQQIPQHTQLDPPTQTTPAANSRRRKPSSLESATPSNLPTTTEAPCTQWLMPLTSIDFQDLSNRDNYATPAKLNPNKRPRHR